MLTKHCIRLFCSALAVALSVSCGNATRVGSRVSPITHGIVDSEYRVVGAMLMTVPGLGTSICTGTVVGAHTVITAAHCVSDLTAPEQCEFYLESDGTGEDDFDIIVPESVSIHPNYVDHPDEVSDDDIALLHFTDALPVEPVPVAVSSPSDGMEITLVGFGGTNDEGDGVGIRRRAINTIDDVDAREFAYLGTGDGIGNICFGDSGGPSFGLRSGQQVVLGVHSYAFGVIEDSICGYGGADTRVDAYINWLRSAAGDDLVEQEVSASPDDTLPPSLTILSPSDGALVEEAFTIDVDAEDNEGIAYVALAIDGEWTEEDHDAPFQFNVELMAGASAAIKIRAVDINGLVSDEEIVVTVDATEVNAGDDSTNTNGGLGGGSSGPTQIHSAHGCQMGGSGIDPGVVAWLLIAFFLRPRRVR